MKNFFSLAAVLVFSIALPSAITRADETSQKNSQSIQRIDLLPLVDNQKENVVGTWNADNGALTSDMGPGSRIQFRYNPPAEYDVHAIVSREKGNGGTTIILVGGGKQIALLMAHWNNTIVGFEMIGKDRANSNQSTVRFDSVFENGKKYNIDVRVRNTGVQVLINSKSITEFKTDYSNMSLPSGWKIPDSKALGVASGQTSFKFYAFEVTEQSGKGVVNPIPAAPAPANTIAKTPPESPRNPPSTPAIPQAPHEITIASGPPPASNAQAPAAPVPPVDPNAIERPEFRDKPKPLVKSITSVTSMMVQVAADGDMTGLTADIIATVPPDSRRSGKAGIGFVRNDGDDTMKTALEEAVRAVTLRYPLWEAGHIDLSFGEKFVKHGGPSAGTAFGILMLSLLEGFDIDSKCAVTGDITVDWKVRKVGGVTAKVRGATLDKCLYAAIPENNETAFADMGVLYGNSALWNIQVFSIATLQDAVAIARKDREPKLTEAIKLFSDLQSQLTANDKALAKPETRQSLKKILDLAPNHLSAKYLLAINEGKASKTLSANATLYRLQVILSPYMDALYSKRIDRSSLAGSTTLSARKQLASLRLIANKDIASLVSDESAFIESMDQFAANPAGYTADSLITRAKALDARFDELANDKDLRGMLRREGY